MDPLTALSTAGTIIQFVDFGIKVLVAGNSLYHSTTGAIPENVELEWVTRDLMSLTTKVSQAGNLSEPAPDNVYLNQICVRCEEIGKNLLTRLERLKLKSNKGVLQRFHVALKATWARKDLEELVLQLGKYKRSIETHFLVDLRYVDVPPSSRAAYLHVALVASGLTLLPFNIPNDLTLLMASLKKLSMRCLTCKRPSRVTSASRWWLCHAY
jgi:hypothetical protein